MEEKREWMKKQPWNKVSRKWRNKQPTNEWKERCNKKRAVKMFRELQKRWTLTIHTVCAYFCCINSCWKLFLFCECVPLNLWKFLQKTYTAHEQAVNQSTPQPNAFTLCALLALVRCILIIREPTNCIWNNEDARENILFGTTATEAASAAAQATT